MKKNFSYEKKQAHQLKSWFSASSRKDKMAFPSFEALVRWYENEPKQCHYCEIPEEIIQEVVMRGKLRSARFPRINLKARGRNRGKWLEIDRKKPDGYYSTRNCVLACYFCNNDKSDVFTDGQYQEFFQNRAQFLRSLLR